MPFARSFVIGLLALSLSAPAAAQFTQSHKFLDAMHKKDDKAALEAIDAHVDINTVDSVSRESALHIAASQRRADWIAHLVGLGANVNAHDVKGQTPLVVAVNANFTAGAQFLIQHGARLEDSNNVGETPLITAVHNRNLELIKLLLKAGADPDRADNSGRSARDYAVLDSGRGGNLAATIDANARPGGTSAGPRRTYGPKL